MEVKLGSGPSVQLHTRRIHHHVLGLAIVASTFNACFKEWLVG